MAIARKGAETRDALDLFGTVSAMEPTHDEVVADAMRKSRVECCACGCGRWLIAGEETRVDDKHFHGWLALGCAVAYGYVPCHTKKIKEG